MEIELLGQIRQDRIITHREFNGFLGSHAHELRHQASVKAREALVSQDLFETVQTIAVHDLAYIRAGSLILHACLDQINGINGRRSGGSGNRTQGETIDGLKHLN